jgi:hypothetical protein
MKTIPPELLSDTVMSDLPDTKDLVLIRFPLVSPSSGRLINPEPTWRFNYHDTSSHLYGLHYAAPGLVFSVRAMRWLWCRRSWAPSFLNDAPAALEPPTSAPRGYRLIDDPARGMQLQHITYNGTWNGFRAPPRTVTYPYRYIAIKL